MSPIRTVITTITRKSVNMVAELDYDTAPSRILDTLGQRLEGNSTAAKAATATAVALYTNSWPVLNLNSPGPKPRFCMRLLSSHRANSEPTPWWAEYQDDLPRSLDRLGNSTFRLGLQSQEQSQEQHVRPDKDQLTTDTADLKMTKDALAEDTTAFEDTTQDCLVCQTKVAYFEVYTNKNLSEELEALVKAKIVISEKTGNAEYRDNRSVLSSHGGLVREVITSENSIALVQIASRIDSAMHDEISNDYDPFAKVKGLISDMITRS